jgi:hypothetical protein
MSNNDFKSTSRISNSGSLHRLFDGIWQSLLTLPQWVKVVGHVVVIFGSLVLLASLGGAGVMASPVLGPLLLFVTVKTHGLLRYVYGVLLGLLILEVVGMAVVAITS